MRVLVCGGRDFSDRDLMARTLAPYRPSPITAVSEHKIIQGGAIGADTLAREWAEVYGVPYREFPADWNKHGRAAGPIRNQRMIDEGKPDLVIAFPGGRGTADMISRAEKAGIRVMRVRPLPRSTKRIAT
ncbi:MAG TPA: SLOG family protein [Terriglobales bacterium]|nr:SLOG family protein [Terriglobales bacterium]